MSVPPTCVVHIREDGSEDYLLFGAGEVRFLVVDERSPHDRVYRLTVRSHYSQLRDLLADSPIGDRFEERHAAIAAAVEARQDGRRHMMAVPSE